MASQKKEVSKPSSVLLKPLMASQRARNLDGVGTNRTDDCSGGVDVVGVGAAKGLGGMTSGGVDLAGVMGGIDCFGLHVGVCTAGT